LVDNVVVESEDDDVIHVSLKHSQSALFRWLWRDKWRSVYRV